MYGAIVLAIYFTSTHSIFDSNIFHFYCGFISVCVFFLKKTRLFSIVFCCCCWPFAFGYWLTICKGIDRPFVVMCAGHWLSTRLAGTWHKPLSLYFYSFSLTLQRFECEFMYKCWFFFRFVGVTGMLYQQRSARWLVLQFWLLITIENELCTRLFHFVTI